MREIKFRAWDKKAKEMIYEALEIKNIGLGDGSVLVDAKTQGGNELTWLQYTGLKDKNGKEIYEGDIIQCKYYQKAWKEEVKYDVDYSGFLPFCEPIDYDEIYLSDYGVIGNIYENPGLLEGK